MGIIAVMSLITLGLRLVNLKGSLDKYLLLAEFLVRTVNYKTRICKYILFDGLAYNTCGYFASCVVFFRAPQGRGKIRAMSKMSARIIC